MWTQHEIISLIELKICLTTLDRLSCLPINKPFLSTMLKKIVLNQCLHWRKVNTALSDFIQSTYPKQKYLKIFNEEWITHLLKNFKIDDETFSVYFFLGSAPFTPYCRDILKEKNVGIRTFMSAKKNLFLDFYFNMIIKNLWSLVQMLTKWSRYF